ncbi:MAG: MFS transporter [Blastomonas sp.]
MASAPICIDDILDRPEMGRYRWNIYIVCGLLMALEGYDAYIVSNLAPIVARGLNIPIPSMGFIFTAQAAGMALGFYTVPILADRIGRRGIMLIGAAAFGVLTIISAMVTTMESFAFVRFLGFFALGGTWPNIIALASEFMPESRRSRLLTWLFISHGMGASFAGFVGPTFVALHSWQSAFWAGGIAMLIFVPFMARVLPESIRYLVNRDGSDPRVGQILQRVDPGLAWSSGDTFFTRETKVAGSTVFGLFRDGRAVMTMLLWLGMGSSLYVTATLTAWLPSYLHVLGGLETSTATRMSAFSALGSISGPVMLTYLMKRFGTPLALCLTCAGAFITMMGISLVAEFPALGWGIGVCFGLLVVGAQAGLNSLVASSYPTSIRSTGIGWAGGVGRLTSMIGPGVGGAILAAQLSPAIISFVVAGPMILAFIAMLAFHLLGISKLMPSTAQAETGKA